MRYAIAPLSFKPGRLTGLSEKLLVSHYQNNYGGALRRLNVIADRLAAIDFGKAPAFDINGLKREELIALGSVTLHEIYFSGLGGDGSGPDGDLAGAIERDFGSIEKWRKEFVGMGKALGGGSGWVLLLWSARAGRLLNQWASDHAHGLADSAPVLALDMYEHAYQMDFGAKADAYVDTVMKNLDWDRISARHRAAIGTKLAPDPASAIEDALAVEDLRRMLDRQEPVIVLDVCLEEDLAKRNDMIPTAELRPPEQIEEWAPGLPRSTPIAVYCVYGFQVSGDVVAKLRNLGLDARRVAGGIAAWHAIGAPTVPMTPVAIAGKKTAQR